MHKKRSALRDSQNVADMRTAGQYKAHAAECVRLAEEAKKPEDKAMLLGMAETWTRLAEQAERKENKRR